MLQFRGSALVMRSVFRMECLEVFILKRVIWAIKGCSDFCRTRIQNSLCQSYSWGHFQDKHAKTPPRGCSTLPAFQKQQKEILLKQRSSKQFLLLLLVVVIHTAGTHSGLHLLTLTQSRRGQIGGRRDRAEVSLRGSIRILFHILTFIPNGSHLISRLKSRELLVHRNKPGRSGRFCRIRNKKCRLLRPS